VVRYLTVTHHLASYSSVMSEQDHREEERADGDEPVFQPTDPVLSPSGRILGGLAKTMNAAPKAAKTQVDRCIECAAPLTEGICGNCSPTGRPLDKGERRRRAAAAEHEKEQWDRHLVARKSHARRGRSPGT
jgi:hypothetical protein